MDRTKVAKTDNLVDAKLKASFIECRDEWQKLNDRANSAAAKRRQYQKEIKEHGFSVQQIKISLLLQTPEGEAEFKAEMANRLLAAAYSDADIGDQLSLFLDGDRTPAVDRAYKEGQTMAMKNEAAVPKYDPSTPQHAAFMEGYHAEQERQVKSGIGKLDAKAAKANKSGKKVTAKPAKGTGKRGRPKKAAEPDLLEAAGEPAESRLITKQEKADRAAALAQAKAREAKEAKDSGPPRKPAAAPVTRASLAATKAQAKEDAESYFSRSAETKGSA